MKRIRRRNNSNRRPEGLLTRQAHSLLLKAPSSTSVTSLSSPTTAIPSAAGDDGDGMDESYGMLMMDDSAVDFYDPGRRSFDSGDLETATGCPTTEGDRRVTVPTHKKNDDRDDTSAMDPRQRLFHQTLHKVLQVLTLVYHKTSFVLDHYVFDELPLCLRVALVIHMLTCLYALKAIWCYHEGFCGTLCAFFITTCVGASFFVTSITAMATMKAAQVELSESIIQEGRSRAILNTLYPISVLQQMYADLRPEQIMEAQQQVQREMEEQFLYNRYDDEDDDEVEVQMDTDQPIQPPHQRPSRTSSRGSEATSLQVVQENDMESSQYHHGNEGEQEDLDQQPVNTEAQNSPSEALRKSLGYDDGDDDLPEAIPMSSVNESDTSPIATPSSTPNATPVRQRTQQRQLSPTPLAAISRKKISRSKSSEEYISLSAVRSGGRNPHKQHSNNTIDTFNNSSASMDNESSESNNQHHNTIHNGGNGNHCIMQEEGDMIMCMKRNSITLRRQSISRRVTMAHHRRVSVGYGRRRSSMGTSSVNSSTGSSVGRPIQERFAHTTVLFADIAGFTHWCSVREPCHVFTLLESIYFAFDELARNLGVYKIETIGDCYVAVTGIPNPTDDHAVIMAHFASRIINEFEVVVSGLVEELGEGTEVLRLRGGCHSGSTVAGVLRGDKGRFQLFGDTVNTAARMESNGVPGKVQISEEMARALAFRGKSHYYRPREDKIQAKGKGMLQTFFLEESLQTRHLKQNQKAVSLWKHLDDVLNIQEQKLQDALGRQLELLVKKIVSQVALDSADPNKIDWEDALAYEEAEGSILDELNAEANYDVPSLKNTDDGIDFDSVVLPAKVVLELRAFVQAITSNFQKNPYHCFEHACHAVRSMIQLVEHLQKTCPTLKRDPLAQLVIILISMVHDVDNPGVTNAQLMTEDAEMADYFNNTCLTQQNALDVAWELLTGDTCQHLLKAICSHSATELDRFRKYMVHGMLATDGEDRDLRLARHKRWKRADFVKPCQQSIVVVEQCLQLSDVIHNVQTVEFFLKWTERCFREEYLAYIRDRRDDDPCLTYYEDQLDLLKNDVLPHADRFAFLGANNGKRGGNHHSSTGFLGRCRELLQRAKDNKDMWEKKGQDRVKEMAKSAKYEFGEKQV